MKTSYFTDTDTLYIQLNNSSVSESRDLDDSTVLDLDSAGNIVAITMEHASQRTDLQNLVISGIAA